MVRVLVVDDHRMFAESLTRLLDDEDDIEVAGIAATIAEAETGRGATPPTSCCSTTGSPTATARLPSKPCAGAAPPPAS